MKKNIIIQFLYQLIILLLPLIISPYLTRTLGSEAIGQYSYYISIATYFVIFANLGIVTYGTRTIAKCKNDKLLLRKKFSELFYIHFFISIISCFLYLIYSTIYFNYENNIILYICSIYVFATLFDVTWLFQGLETFLLIAVRNILVKVIEFILIFTLVKNANDVYIYSYIMVCSVLIGYLTLLPPAIKKVGLVSIKKCSFKSHIKPLILLGMSSIAVTIYAVFDKTLLGALSNKSNVAFYEYSEKIAKIPATVLGAIGTVAIPHITQMFENNNIEGIKRSIKSTFLIISFLSCAFAFGLASIADILIPLYYGNGFKICSDYVLWLSALILILPIGDIFRTQYLIPAGHDSYLLFTLIINAIINFILNLILIPHYGVNGAIIGTLLAEGIGMLTQFYYVKIKLKMKYVFLDLIPFLLIGLFMFIINKYVLIINVDPILLLIIKISCGIFVYLSISFIYLIIFKRKEISNLKLNLLKRRGINE